MIQMRAHHYVLITQRAIRAAQYADDVRCIHGRVIYPQRRVEPRAQREHGERLPGIRQRQHLRVAVPRSLEQSLGELSTQRDEHAAIGGIIVEAERRTSRCAAHRTSGRRTSWWEWIGDRYRRDRAEALQFDPARGAAVREHRRVESL